ncbi:hypothetical protein RHSIM_Rhsim07G0051900 [Rhododendron simsii]|uniref:Uncharacterized protein n=1 Tax=Rhododendron simsii TaxID=118357 RepID=A0A834GPB6_RHOSS|nr:hypothetical protein RHSIM_Rhsim07G0051900 [Rhododendron simsii]
MEFWMTAKNNEEEAEEFESNEEEAEKVVNEGLNDNYQSSLKKVAAAQAAMSLGNHATDENSNVESINSALGLDSIVQDSQSPLTEECLESVNNSSQLQYAEARVGENQKQGKDGGFWDNNLVQCDSNIYVRVSQVHGINLHVDLNPSAVRRNIRSQQLEASVNSEGDDIAEYIIASQEQEQNEIGKEVQNTIIAGNSLGIKFGDAVKVLEEPCDQPSVVEKLIPIAVPDSSSPLMEENEDDDDDDDELDEHVVDTDEGNEMDGEEKGGNNDNVSMGDGNVNLIGDPTKHDKEQVEVTSTKIAEINVRNRVELSIQTREESMDPTESWDSNQWIARMDLLMSRSITFQPKMV